MTAVIARSATVSGRGFGEMKDLARVVPRPRRSRASTADAPCPGAEEDVMNGTKKNCETMARKRVQARVGFISHLLLYACVNAGLAFIWAFSGRGYPWFVWPLVCWGAAVVVHAVMLWIGPDSRGEERAVARELDRLRLRAAPR
jgi:hypothetical protein